MAKNLKKNCIHCGIELNRNNRCKTIYRKDYNIFVKSNICKNCSNKSATKRVAKWRKRNPEGYKICYTERNIKKQQVAYYVKKILMDIKGNKCEMCGYDDLSCLAVFEFHHKDPDKKEDDFAHSLKSISAKTLQNAIIKLKKESEHCMLLCANCHRKLHHRIVTGIITSIV